MDKPMSKFGFQMMSFAFFLRDLSFDPATWLKEAGIKESMTVLDYGCGPGTYTIAAAKMVKETGKVYALDIQPLAHKKISRKARKNGLQNIIPIITIDENNVTDKSIDVVLLYDVFHMFSEKDNVLNDIYRILKPDGILSFSDHHMKEADIMGALEKQNLFMLTSKELYTFNYIKQ